MDGMGAPSAQALETPTHKRLARLKALWNLLMAVLAFASLGPILWVELEGVHWPDPRFQVLAAVDLLFVTLFGADFVIGLRRAQDRGQYWRQHWHELPALVPLYAEAYSWLRVTQLLRLARVLRLLRALSAYRRMRSLALLDVLINRNKLGHTLVLSSLVVVGMATVVWMLERHTNPHLAEFSDALWWAIVTATTVGYGDITPQTGLARMVATGLMLMGIGLIGVVASSLSSALLTVTAEEERQEAKSAPGLVDELERLAALRERGHLTEDEFTSAKRRLLG